MVTFPVFSLTLFFLLYCLFPCLPSLCKLKPSQAIVPAFQLQFKPSQAIVPAFQLQFKPSQAIVPSSIPTAIQAFSGFRTAFSTKNFLNSTSLSLVHPGLPASVISSCMTLSWSSPLGRDTFTRQYTFMSKPSLA